MKECVVCNGNMTLEKETRTAVCDKCGHVEHILKVQSISININDVIARISKIRIKGEC